MMSRRTEPQWEEFLAGWGAGFTNVVLTFPIHKTMFRQMLHGVPTNKAIEQIRKEGFRLLYRGVFPPLCQKTISTSIMFGSYEYYVKLMKNSFPGLNSQVSKSVGAGLAGASEAILTPFERLQTLMQDKNYNTKLNNSLHAVRHIWKHHGVLEFYRGASTIIFRNSLANIVFFATREHAQQALPRPDQLWSRYIFDFLSGGLIGAAISTLYFPVNVIKTRMQSRLGGPYESPRKISHLVFVERGSKLSELFRGVHLNYTRALLSWGIINASYELIKGIIHTFQDKDDKS